MAELTQVPKSDWRPFFDRMSRGLLGKLAEIEVASLDLGDQVVAEWIPLFGITYDVQDNSLDVVLDRATHVISQPREIVVEETAGGLSSVAVVDEAGERQVIRLKEPLKLPAAATSSR